MDLDMLPAQSYEDAIPFLRRPYTPNLVRGLVINAPDTPTAPCTIGLYAIGESLMDRLNLVCGRDWDHDFEIVGERTLEVDGKTFYYCEAQAMLEVFGVVRKDIGALDRRDARPGEDERQGAGVEAHRPLARAWPVPIRHRGLSGVPWRGARQAARTEVRQQAAQATVYRQGLQPDHSQAVRGLAEA